MKKSRKRKYLKLEEIEAIEKQDEITPDDLKRLLYTAKLFHIQYEQTCIAADALDFYADPLTYTACAFLIDPPAGDFSRDFDVIDGRQRPGKEAREAWLKIEALNPKLKSKSHEKHAQQSNWEKTDSQAPGCDPTSHTNQKET